jgi:hypothetical protein
MAQPQLAPGLARKVKKVLDTRLDAPEVLDSLKALSEFFPENTPAARRGTRAALSRPGLRAALTCSTPGSLRQDCAQPSIAAGCASTKSS